MPWVQAQWGHKTHTSPLWLKVVAHLPAPWATPVLLRVSRRKAGIAPCQGCQGVSVCDTFHILYSSLPRVQGSLSMPLNGSRKMISFSCLHFLTSVLPIQTYVLVFFNSEGTRSGLLLFTEFTPSIPVC